MPNKAEKLLEKMRASNKQWKRNDVDSLYKGYGFIIVTKGRNHDKVYHPDFPFLVTFIPRHVKIGEYVVDDAVRLVSRLIELRNNQRSER